MSKRFVAIVNQRGDGCDYSIGCGTAVSVVMEAESIEEATARVLAEWPPWSPHGERDIARVTIYEVAAAHDIGAALAAEVERLKGEHKAAQQAEKMRKIAALQKEIEGT
jgi:uncharacterized small protein (DUF1192 family)